MIIFDASPLITFLIQGFRDGLIFGMIVWFVGFCMNYIIKLFRHVA